MRLLLALVFSTYFCTCWAGEILIATVAQVKNHVITSREVQIHFLLNKTLGTNQDFFEDVNPVEQLIREWLLFFEANSFYNNPVPAAEVQTKIQKISEPLEKNKDWQQLSVGPEELKEMMRRRLEAERLYLFKKKASVLPVSPADVESEYTQNRIRYGNMSFEEVKDKIRHKKIQENLEARLSQWFLVLEKKYKVQRFAKFNGNKD